MQKEYTLKDLRRDTKGMRVHMNDLNSDFSRALVKIIGENEAVKWFYNTPNENLENKTPYEVVRDRDEGRRIISEFLDDMINGAFS